MAETEISPQARSPWIVLEWFYKPFRKFASPTPKDFGVAVSVFNVELQQFRRMGVRMAWPPTPMRLAMARRKLWEWIGQLETDVDVDVGGAIGDETLEGRERWVNPR